MRREKTPYNIFHFFPAPGKAPPLPPPPQKNAQVGSRSAATGNYQYVHRNGHILHAEKFAEIRWEKPSNFTGSIAKESQWFHIQYEVRVYFLQRSRSYVHCTYYHIHTHTHKVHFVQFICVSASLQPITDPDPERGLLWSINKKYVPPRVKVTKKKKPKASQ